MEPKTNVNLNNKRINEIKQTFLPSAISDIVETTADVSASTIAKLGKNQPISMESMTKICTMLKCDIGDIVQLVEDETCLKESSYSEPMEVARPRLDVSLHAS